MPECQVPIDTRRARRHLVAFDPAMAALIQRVGPCPFRARVHADPFSTLLRLDDDALRGAGLSRAKVLYVRDLAAHVQDDRLDLRALPAHSDEDAIAALTAVKGIGTWTAEVFLMFHLERPDVFPPGDLALMVAIQRAYQMRARPTPEKARALAETWRPHRSVASWYLWQSLFVAGRAVSAVLLVPTGYLMAAVSVTLA